MEKLPRSTIIQQALERCKIILVKNMREAIEINNQYAPEHLILQVAKPRRYIDAIQNAGAVFLGPWTPR